MKFNKYFLLAALLLIPAATSPMGRDKQYSLFGSLGALLTSETQTNIKMLGTKLLKSDLFFSASGALVACAVSLITDKLRKNKFLQLPDVPSIVQDFAQTQLQEIGLNSKIPIKENKKEGEDYGLAFDDQIIILGNTDILKLALKNNHIDHPFVLNAKGTIQHEGTHIKHKHHQKKYLLGVPALILACYASTQISNKSANSLKGNITLAAITALLPLLIHYAQTYYHEWQADEGIQNDAKLLRALAEKYREYARDHDTNLTFLERLIDTHPHPLKRAQRFDQRADEIERVAALKEKKASYSAKTTKDTQDEQAQQA